MRDERTDSRHIDGQTLEKQNVVRNRFDALIGQSDHGTRTDFIAQLLQIQQTAQTVVPAHLRVKAVVQLLVRRFDSQQIPVRPRVAVSFVFVVRLFPQAERQSHIHVFYRADDDFHFVDGIPNVFARLHNDCFVAQLFRLRRQIDDLFDAQTVAALVFVVAADSAIQAVVAAKV